MAPTVLPELDIQKLRRFCSHCLPEHARDQVRPEVSVKAKLVSVHVRPPPSLGRAGEWNSMPIAVLRYEGKGLASGRPSVPHFGKTPGALTAPEARTRLYWPTRGPGGRRKAHGGVELTSSTSSGWPVFGLKTK